MGRRCGGETLTPYRLIVFAEKFEEPRRSTEGRAPPRSLLQSPRLSPRITKSRGIPNQVCYLPFPAPLDRVESRVFSCVMKGDVGLGVNNAWKLWYSLSTDGIHFENEREMFQSLNGDDRYIFAVGYVRSGNALLGVLYGAGATAGLDRNQIFGRWLQKKVVITEETGNPYPGPGAEYDAAGALGPDRQEFKVPIDRQKLVGTLTVYAEDGITPLGSTKVEMEAGKMYSLVWK